MSAEARTLLCKCTHLSTHLHRWPSMEVLFTVSMNHNNKRRARLENSNESKRRGGGGVQWMHIFFADRVRDKHQMTLASCIPVALDSCIRLQSEKHKKKTPASQSLYISVTLNKKCNKQVQDLTNINASVLMTCDAVYWHTVLWMRYSVNLNE